MADVIVEKLKTAWSNRPRPQYWLTRLVFLRSLAFIYAIGFMVAAQQFKPLLGQNGLLPVKFFLAAIKIRYGGALAGFLQFPSLFWLTTSDIFSTTLAWAGFALSVAAFLGFSSSIIYFLMWFFYLSFVNVGQVFYGFGWESMMLESGFLAIFLCNSLGPKTNSESSPPPVIIFWFLRWMLFRVMFGAGLIKIRGDACWLDLTCLQYHYETQPIPNPLSWYFHHMSFNFHRAQVIFTHFVELGVPWGYFGPRPVRRLAGFITIIFQVILIFSGNLSWLNYLTIVIAIACFDDSTFESLFSRGYIKKIKAMASHRAQDLVAWPRQARRITISVLTVLILVFSIKPALNLFSHAQIMNTSFDPFHLVNTYGAFGSIQKKRSEVILSGTLDDKVNDQTTWVEYQFKCKPGDVKRRPCVMSPYHYRIDWQMWFAAMSDYRYNDWLVHMVYKLLEGDKDTLSLLAGDPFNGEKPKFIRADLYQYHFTDADDKSGAWWKRGFEVSYLPPLSLDNVSLKNFIQENGWN